MLKRLDALPSVLVVDGYVWLDEDARKGLGAHLFDALAGRAAIVGVAKHAFHGAVPRRSSVSRQARRTSTELRLALRLPLRAPVLEVADPLLSRNNRDHKAALPRPGSLIG